MILDLFKKRKYQSTTITDRKFVGLESVPAALQALEQRETSSKVVVTGVMDQRWKGNGRLQNTGSIESEFCVFVFSLFPG